MRNWRNYLVLTIGILLMLVSFVIYGLRIQGTAPVIQNGWFLRTFLLGITLLGIYGTVRLSKQGFKPGVLVMAFIILMLVTNTVTMFNFLFTAQRDIGASLAASVFSLIVVLLALANFGFLLVVWNGRRWGVWAYGICSFVLCTLKFVGHIPIFPVLFELSAVVILIYLLRSIWPEMD